MEKEKEEIETDSRLEAVSVGSQIPLEPAEQAAEAIETEALQGVADAAGCPCPQTESAAGAVDADVSQGVGEVVPEPAAEAIAPPVGAAVERPRSRYAGAQPSQGNVIELRDVSLYHSRGFSGGRHPRRRDDELVLSDVNLAVAPGEMVYLIGKVGSGKSTLLKTLYAEVPLYEGFGEVVGFNLRKLRRRDIPMLRRKMGIVFQDYQLLTDRNVFHNLHYVMGATGWRDEAQMRGRIEEVLGLVGLGTKAYKMPWELSGGEQQRLAIARALINHPRVILADEPTGNLDPAAAEEIMALFRQIVNTGCSIVMSTHNIANIQSYPGHTIRFAGGHIEQIDIRSILGISE